MKVFNSSIITISLLLAGFFGFYTQVNSDDSVAASDNKIKVFVSILPQAYFVEKIAGERADIEVFVGPGHSPATYDPTPLQITRLTGADLYFRIGVPFETGRIDKLATIAKQLQIIDTRQGIEQRNLPGHAGHEHHHGEHLDPHIWLDPTMVKQQIVTITNAFIARDSSRTDYYRSNLAEFTLELDSVNALIETILADMEVRKMFVFHPAYGYFAEAYGLEQVAIEIEGKKPSARMLVEVIDKARVVKPRALFVQPEFASSTAQTVADALNCELLELDPLGKDYLENIVTIARRVASGAPLAK